MKQIDPNKLRGWGKQIHQQTQNLKRRVERLEAQPLMEESRGQDYVKHEYKPIHYPPAWLPELEETRRKLCQVQNWTSVGQNEEGERLLSSLETGTVKAGLVYLAVHRKAILEGKKVPAYEDWVRGLEPKTK